MRAKAKLAVRSTLRAWATVGIRWSAHGWASVAVLAACHAAPPPVAAGTADTVVASTSCRVSVPVCDPTVTDEVALALVRRRCAGCHAEGGKAEHPLLEPSGLFPERGDVALRLSGCEMPPDDTPLPPDERRRLIGWGGCAPPAAAGEP